MASSGYKLTFGPPGDQWVYDPWLRTYDLTRAADPASDTSRRRFTVETSHGPADVKITICPEQTALVVVDMQNFFLNPKCRDNPNGLAVVEPTANMVEKSRALGMKVRSR